MLSMGEARLRAQPERDGGRKGPTPAGLESRKPTCITRQQVLVFWQENSDISWHDSKEQRKTCLISQLMQRNFHRVCVLEGWYARMESNLNRGKWGLALVWSKPSFFLAKEKKKKKKKLSYSIRPRNPAAISMTSKYYHYFPTFSSSSFFVFPFIFLWWNPYDGSTSLSRFLAMQPSEDLSFHYHQWAHFQGIPMSMVLQLPRDLVVDNKLEKMGYRMGI